MKIDWLSKLRHALQVWAFCLAVSAIQYAFTPERLYGPSVVYSLCIGTITWAIVDLGRHGFRTETGWPAGLPGALLVAGGLIVGYLGGNAVADLLCRVLGLYAGTPVYTPRDRTRDILVSAIAGVVGIFYFYSVNKSAYLERKMVEERQHANEARLKLLEAQLEPHMLFNTLANLRALIGVDAQRAQQMLDHIIAYLRATLNASRAPTHSLQAEFDRLRDYLELMAIRMGSRLAYALDLPAELASQPIPTLLLQPLVENSIQHGLEPKVQGGRIQVSARRDGERIVLEVSDTGVGTAPAPGPGKGFGLNQVRERLATLYGDGAGLAFSANEAEGARAIIHLPAAA
ncbi:sensor histidine kinase [Caenimonas sedimenti]|uniref:histidine kinase n=1 Tax=Caenimonas sedimenti TaxID=2596921 RepID=A0A562ZMG9_9BURK|nr:histidine kinase [Caenimonas sedimenti]TWO69515.1 sensor histidine kinase [Caenimonas sedimenti]